MVDIFIILGTFGILAVLAAGGLWLVGPVGVRRLAMRYATSTGVTALGIAGVAMGLVVIIVIKSVVAGLVIELDRRMRAVAADVTIRRSADEETLDNIERLPEIAAAGLETTVPVGLVRIASDDDFSIKHCLVRGIDPKRAFRVSDIGRYIDFGARGREAMTGRWIVGGADLFAAPDVEPGDTVILQLITQRGAGFAKTAPEEFTVAGILESGFPEVDRNVVFIPQGYIDERFPGGGIPQIKLRLAEGVSAESAMAGFDLPPGAWYTYRDQYGQYLRAVEHQGGLLLLMSSVVIAVSAVCIVGLVVMITMQKVRDIGILRAVGAGRGTILAAFLGYAILVGLVGTGLGLVGSAVTLWRIDDVKLVVMKVTGYNPISKKIYTDEAVPVHWRAELGRSTLVEGAGRLPFIVMVPAAAIGVVTLGALAPAWWAARHDPVRAIHYE